MQRWLLVALLATACTWEKPKESPKEASCCSPACPAGVGLEVGEGGRPGPARAVAVGKGDLALVIADRPRLDVEDLRAVWKLQRRRGSDFHVLWERELTGSLGALAASGEQVATIRDGTWLQAHGPKGDVAFLTPVPSPVDGASLYLTSLSTGGFAVAGQGLPSSTSPRGWLWRFDASGKLVGTNGLALTPIALLQNGKDTVVVGTTQTGWARQDLASSGIVGAPVPFPQTWTPALATSWGSGLAVFHPEGNQVTGYAASGTVAWNLDRISAPTQLLATTSGDLWIADGQGLDVWVPPLVKSPVSHVWPTPTDAVVPGLDDGVVAVGAVASSAAMPGLSWTLHASSYRIQAFRANLELGPAADVLPPSPRLPLASTRIVSGKRWVLLGQWQVGAPTLSPAWLQPIDAQGQAGKPLQVHGAPDPWEAMALAPAGNGLVLLGRAVVQGQPRPVLYRLDGMGNPLWEAWPAIEDLGAGPPIAVAGHGDGGATVLVRRWATGESTGWLCRVTATGEPGWTHELSGMSSEGVAGGDVTGMPDGGVWAAFGEPQLPASPKEVQLRRLDASGKVALKLLIPLVRVDRLLGTSDGGCLAFGLAAQATQAHSRRLVRVSTDGQVHWSRTLTLEIEDTGQVAPTLMEPLPDGDLLLGGSGPSSAWLARLDGQGRLRWLRHREFPGRPVLRLAFPLPGGRLHVAGTLDLQPLTWRLDRWGNTYCPTAAACVGKVCDDGDPCTQDLCTEQGCHHPPTPSTTCAGPGCPQRCPADPLPP